MEKDRILLKLKENYDYKILGIDFLRDGGGTTYTVNGEEQKFFLKIAGKAFRNTIRQSVDIVRYLSGKGFPVPDIIETKWGMPMLETHEQGQEYLFILYEYIDGKEPNSFSDRENLYGYRRCNSQAGRRKGLSKSRRNNKSCI